jgi:DNA-binding transcriptional ArsR family regulator
MDTRTDLLDPAVRDLALAFFRAIAHPDRLQVLLALADGERCVSDLTALCGSSQSSMSHQLRALRDAGLVRAERRGKQVFYLLDDHHVTHIVRDAIAHVREDRRFVPG